MRVLEHFAVSDSDGDLVLGKWLPGEMVTDGNVIWEAEHTTWAVYWSDAPSLSPVGYAFHQYDNEQEALHYFSEEAREEARRRK